MTNASERRNKSRTEESTYEETQVVSDLWGGPVLAECWSESRAGVTRITGQSGRGDASGVSLDCNGEQRLGGPDRQRAGCSMFKGHGSDWVRSS